MMEEKKKEEQWMLVADLAKTLGIDRGKVMRLAREGHLKMRVERGDKRKHYLDLIALRDFMKSTTEEEL